MSAARLTGLDTAFLCLDGPAAPMNMGGVAVFTPPQPVHPNRLVHLLRTRATRIPLLHQRLRPNWLPPGTMSWVPDERFEPHQHVLAHRLHAPRYTGQLATKVAEIMAEPLSMSAPPWQLHVITGLAGGRFAVLAKLHHAFADGATATRIVLGLMDGFTEHTTTSASPAPSVGLFGQLRRTGELIGIASSVARHARPRLPNSPLLAAPSSQRRLATMRLALADLKAARRRHGGTGNDVLLAALAGALRHWLRERGHRVHTVPVRALVPVNSRHRAADWQRCGNQLSGYLCDLPVDEPDPVARLRAVRETMDINKKSGTRHGPGALPVLADSVPAAVHRLAAPVLSRSAPLLFDTVVTNVPLPNLPLHLDGAGLTEIYPVVPLAHGHGLAAAFCTYRDTVHIGLHADAVALPDVDRLGELLPHALHELLDPPVHVPAQRKAMRVLVS